ncbi:MAG: hypothetical protein WCP08_14005 [Prolixibacteraceae bacterium]
MKTAFILLFLFIYSTVLHAQTFVANYDESKIPVYSLPDALVFNNGKPVKSSKDWVNRRRELFAVFEKEMYGKVPDGKVTSTITEISKDENACNGLAVRKEIRIILSREGNEIALNLLIYLPKSEKKASLFLGYNFSGNHTVSAESGIQIATSWVRNNPASGITKNLSTEAGRGSDAASWPVSEIIQRGYGVATLYYGDVDPDFDDGFHNGVHSLFKIQRDSSSWGSVAAWAWGLSRVMDCLEKINEVNSKQVIVLGHSRLGKAALWAGVSDPRFAIVISNESGSGGAALSMRKYGETITRTNQAFPHWFCGNFKKYNNKEESLPFDQHELLALIAPRPLYVSTAEEDRWGDPKGSFLACVAASPVYQLLQTEGFPGRVMPALETPVIGTIGYHIRPGKHDVKPYDWKCFMNFADKHFKK